MDPIQNLREMFPNHKESTIRSVLSDMSGSVENAASILIATPGDINTPDRPGYAPNVYLGPQNQYQQSQSSQLFHKFGHIFSFEFLRWPQTAAVRRINRDGTPAGDLAPGWNPNPQPYTPTGNYNRATLNQGLLGDDHLIPQISIDSNLIPGSKKTSNVRTWWDQFKRRFSSKNYQQI